MPVRSLLEPRTLFVLPFTWLQSPLILLSTPTPLLFDPEIVLLKPTRVLLPVSWTFWLGLEETVLVETDESVKIC